MVFFVIELFLMDFIESVVFLNSYLPNILHIKPRIPEEPITASGLSFIFSGKFENKFLILSANA